MAKVLSEYIQNQILNRDIKITYILKINGVDYSSYLSEWNVSYDIHFGSAAAQFSLQNPEGIFGEGGANKLNVGDVVQFIEKYGTDPTEFKRFYGTIDKRVIVKTNAARTIDILCLDYIAMLKNLDINIEIEAEKLKVVDEVLEPLFLPYPNESLSQVFNFSNDSLAPTPPTMILIKDVNRELEDPQHDGFEIRAAEGQLKLGTPLNCLHNYQLIASEYHHYVNPLHVEDILEQILTQEDGYGKYLFGESTAQDVIDKHLTDNYYSTDGVIADVMTPNMTTTTVTLNKKILQPYNTGDTGLFISDTEGLPDAGEAEINGDYFSWTGIATGLLTGIPTTGEYSLKPKAAGNYVKYEKDYSPGQIWYLSYSNVISDLESSDFDTTSPATITYFDKRFGRILLVEPLLLTTLVRCTTNYTFKTLQASGVGLNKISFFPREVDNRYEAINKLRKFVAPNYIIRTKGDDKIWSGYLSQKVNYDYELTLNTKLQYLEDEDLYTRTVLYGKNSDPTNIMFNEGVDFFSTGESYKGRASQVSLRHASSEGDYHLYATGVTGVGYIDPLIETPVLYIDGIPVDSSSRQLRMQPARVEVTTHTRIKSGCHNWSSSQYVKRHAYYYYTIHLPHVSLDPKVPIHIYYSNGVLWRTIPPHSEDVDYGHGVYTVPGDTLNSQLDTVSSATYNVSYSSNDIIINHDNATFLMRKYLIKDLARTTITADFIYWTVMIPVKDIASIIDGRRDTQVQIEFWAEPPSNYPLSVLDMGQIHIIQAMDVIAGFYKPDDYRKFDLDFQATIQYSVDGVNFYNIGDSFESVNFTAGSSVSWEEDEFGLNFRARYLKIFLERVAPIPYGPGMFVVAFSNLAAYNDIVIKGEAKLIPTTRLTQDAIYGDEIVHVISTAEFTEPESGGYASAYIGDIEFTYTGMTATTFTGCELASATDALNGDRVSSYLEDGIDIYDYQGLLPTLGDRMHKDVRVSNELLYSQTKLNNMASAFLREFVKNHTKAQIEVVYSPFLEVGQTIRIVDTYNNIDTNYFIESISDRGGYYNLVIARYPSS